MGWSPVTRRIATTRSRLSLHYSSPIPGLVGLKLQYTSTGKLHSILSVHHVVGSWISGDCHECVAAMDRLHQRPPHLAQRSSPKPSDILLRRLLLNTTTPFPYSPTIQINVIVRILMSNLDSSSESNHYNVYLCPS